MGEAPESASSLAEVREPREPALVLGDVARKAVVAHAEEPLSVAVARMAQSGRTWLPVVAHGDAREIVGEITLEDTLKARVRHLEEEQRRERVLKLTAVLPVWLRRRA